MSGNGIGGNLTQFERNKYFYGKLMTVRDFETEQRYFNEKRHLLNWLIHGIGIVCGLEITEPRIDNGKLKIKLSPGVALDCCGHEIVVGEEFIGKELEVKGTVTDGSNYIYLKYAECEKESVPVLANASTCEEVCCYNRMEEVFELELGYSPGKDKVEVTGNVRESGGTILIKGALVEALQNGLVKGITITTDSGEYNLMLSPGTYDIRASASGYQSNKIENVSQSVTKVDIQLIKETSPKNPKNLWEGIPQEYYEEHLKFCPECEDAKVLLAVIDKSGETLTINKEETYKYRAIVYNNPMLYDLLRNHLIDFNNPHGVTAEQVGALVSVDGVSNPGGDVDLVAGEKITISPDGNNKSITIASTAGVDPATTVTSVEKQKKVGTSIMYAREDHVHALANNIVDFQKLATALQNQLNTVFQYLRERALKCTVINFREVGNRFDSDEAFNLSGFVKDNIKCYEDEGEFMVLIAKIHEGAEVFLEEIREKNLATEESFKDFEESLKYLKEAHDSKDPLKIATAQDEVCFYALLLERIEQ